MQVLADESRVAELIGRLSEQIASDLLVGERSGPWALVGLRSRGDVLARRLAAKLHPDHVGVLDFTLYRDDLGTSSSQPVVQTTEMSFGIDGLDIVLVDDVLMTGRSVRAALQSLIDLGRPRRVWLSVLVDRGGRELPIAADHVALDMTGHAGRRRDDCVASPVGPTEKVEVLLKPTDDRDAIEIRNTTEQGGATP